MRTRVAVVPTTDPCLGSVAAAAADDGPTPGGMDGLRWQGIGLVFVAIGTVPAALG